MLIYRQVRVFSRMIVSAPTFRAAEAFRRVTAEGYLNPNIRLATRFFVLPATIVAALVLLLPPLVAKSALLALRIFLADVVLDEGVQMKLYRYSYPFAATLVLAFVGAAELAKATSRWRGTYINGHKDSSNHVVATWSLAMTELPFTPYLYCLRHLLTPLPMTLSQDKGRGVSGW